MPALTDLYDPEILKHQTFSQVPSVQVLRDKIQDYLDSWKTLEKDDHYISKALGTLRSLYKYIKNRVPPVSLSKEVHHKFMQNQLIKNERHDKVYVSRARSQIRKLATERNTMHGKPLVNSSERTMTITRPQLSNIVGVLETPRKIVVSSLNQICSSRDMTQS